MKAFKWIFLIILLSGMGYLAWHLLSPYSKTEPLDAIPADAVFIAETDNLFDAWEKMTTNMAWSKLKQQPLFAKLGKGIGMMDTIIQSNRHLSEFIGHRRVFVSMHMINSGKYEFAYIIDLRRLSKILDLKDLVGSFSTSSLHIIKLKEQEGDLFQIEMKSSGQKFYCYFNNNLFVGSFSKPIIEKTMQVKPENSLGKDPYFTEIMDKTSNSGIFRIYINYSRLDDYLKSMIIKLDESTRSLTHSLRYSGLTFEFNQDGSIICDGYTMINDSINSTLKAIINSGNGNSSIEEILPDKFSSSVSLCFNKFTSYFDNMQETLKETPYAYDNYQNEIKALESYLGIKVRENFLDWIGDEVTLTQMEPMGLGKNNEFAVFLKTTNTREAQKNLAFIAKRIKNRTPVKIEDVDYKGFTIHYLSVKGFFKMLLGKYFQKLESPYYTVINDYVVFSNHPQVLKKIIDAQTEESYLEKKPEFSDFYSSFGRRSNALVLVNTEGFLKALKYDLRPVSIQEMERNKQNLVSFPYLGFQLNKEGDYFKTRFFAYYKDADEKVMVSEDTSSSDSLAVNDSVQLLIGNWIKEADSYVPVDLKQKMFSENYSNGQVKLEFEIKDGFRNGSYREYYESKAIKIKGEYKDDKKDGTWKFYNENGDLIQKTTFKDGEMKK